jgi:hypothetical protein
LTRGLTATEVRLMFDSASKRCKTCGEVKPLGEYTKDRDKRDGHRGSCRECERRRDRRRYQENRDAKLEYQRQYYEANVQAVRDYQLRYREANPDKISERNQRWYQANHEEATAARRRYHEANRDRLNANQRQRSARIRDAVLEHYGRICACPDCYSTESLGIDHIDGNGRQHRLELFGNNAWKSGAVRFHYWLIKNNFPPGFQTLCGRCNTSKGTGERCRLVHENDVENDAW